MNQENFENSYAPDSSQNNHNQPINNYQSIITTPNDTVDYNHNPQIQPPYIKPRASYTETDRIFSIIALVLGFTTLKVLLNMADGLGLMATTLCSAITLFNYFYSRKQGIKGSKENTVVFYITLILSAMFIITDNTYVTFINFWLVLASNLYFVYASYKSNNNSIILNLFKAAVVSPFYEFGSLFEALFHKTNSSKERKAAEKKNTAPVIVGLIFSIPVCIVVMVLLMSSDQNFGRGIDKIFTTLFDWFFDDLFVNVIQFMFSLPIAMYIFGAVFSRAYKMKHENELRKLPKSSMRILPSSMCNAFLSPLILIYITFVFTQISYLFTTYGTVNDTFDYSEYARSGFFELCAVAIINLTVISAIMFFVKLKNKSLPKSVKIFIVSFCVLTLCLIVTAIVKMLMYINMFGMTPLRIYTSIFMIYLFVMFIVMIVKQFIFKISFTKIAYLLAAFVIAAMAVLPVDGYIAKYNITMYEKGEIGWMGYTAMDELDSSAVGFFAELDPSFSVFNVFSSDPDARNFPAKTYFSSHRNIGDMDIYNFNLTRFFAAKEVSDYIDNYDLENYQPASDEFYY